MQLFASILCLKDMSHACSYHEPWGPGYHSLTRQVSAYPQFIDTYVCTPHYT